MPRIKKQAATAITARPKMSAQQQVNHAAKMSMTSGEALKIEVERKTARNARTLYVRFSEAYPKNVDEIKELHSDIKFVRTPRMAGKDKAGISYAFIEFGDPEECKSAKNKLATTQFKGKELYADFVGENSKAKKRSGKQKGSLNPTRLFVSGLVHGVNETNLMEMFPKATRADIPQRSRKKGTTFGFVQFSTPADAKAAFDAAQNLSINNHKITVLFAKAKESETRKKRKAEKRKVKLNDADEAKRLKLELMQEIEDLDQEIEKCENKFNAIKESDDEDEDGYEDDYVDDGVQLQHRHLHRMRRVKTMTTTIMPTTMKMTMSDEIMYF